MASVSSKLLNRTKRMLRGPNRTAPSRGEEFDADHYDRVYGESSEYRVSYESSRYYSIWTVIVDRVRSNSQASILEIGCGSGQLAEFLRDQGIENYLGFDFSDTAIGLAQNRGLDEDWFVVADAFDTNIYTNVTYDTVICTEVLEHVEHDLKIIEQLREGTRAICTVPNFPYESHVRHFPDGESVRSRYGPFFDDLDVYAIRGRDRADLVYFLFDGRRNGTFSQQD